MRCPCRVIRDTGDWSCDGPFDRLPELTCPVQCADHLVDTLAVAVPTIGEFPGGFRNKLVIQDSTFTLFEADAVYRVQDSITYLPLLESIGGDGARYHRSFPANALDLTRTSRDWPPPAVPVRPDHADGPASWEPDRSVRDRTGTTTGVAAQPVDLIRTGPRRAVRP